MGRTRPMLVGGSWLTATPNSLGLVHGLEAEGLAVWAFDRAGVPAIAVVADAVAGYHFERCDAVIAIGGGAAMDVARASVLMAGQRSPYRELADRPGADGAPIDASRLPPLLMLPSTPVAALALGAVVWVADETGVALPVRHPALRADEAILADDLIGVPPVAAFARSAAVAAMVAADAGAAGDDLDALLSATDDRPASMRAAARLSSAIEGAVGPRRRLALTAAVIAGSDFGRTLAALSPPDLRGGVWPGDPVGGDLGGGDLGGGDLGGGDLGGGDLGDALPDPRVVRAVRDACRPGDAAELNRVLDEYGLASGDAPRRRGRRGRAP